MTTAQVISSVKAIRVTLDRSGSQREGVQAIVTRETIESFCPDVGPEQSDLLNGYLAHSLAIDKLILEKHQMTGQSLVIVHIDEGAAHPPHAAAGRA